MRSIPDVGRRGMGGVSYPVVCIRARIRFKAWVGKCFTVRRSHAQNDELDHALPKSAGNLHAGGARLGAGAGQSLMSCLTVATGMVLLGHVWMTFASVSYAAAFFCAVSLGAGSIITLCW